MDSIAYVNEEARRHGMSYGQYAATLPQRVTVRAAVVQPGKRRCAECGRPIPPDAPINRKYCSQACREAAARRQHRGYYYNRRDRQTKDDQRRDVQRHG